MAFTREFLSNFTLRTICYKWLPASTTSTGYKSSMKQNFSKKSFFDVFLSQMTQICMKI